MGQLLTVPNLNEVAATPEPDSVKLHDAAIAALLKLPTPKPSTKPALIGVWRGRSTFGKMPVIIELGLWALAVLRIPELCGAFVCAV
jgi:hypothetical protein